MTTLYKLIIEYRHIDTREYCKTEEFFISPNLAKDSAKCAVEYYGSEDVRATLTRLTCEEDGEFFTDGNSEYLHVGKLFLDDTFFAIRRAQREYEAMLDAFDKQKNG